MVGLPGSERLSDWGYAAGWRVVRALPEPVARSTFDAGARYAARGGGPEQLRKNLARVLGVAPERVPASLMRASLSSYARYWREAFRLPSMDLPAVAAQVDRRFIGADKLEAAHAAGRGGVLALPHSGNWDMAGVWLAQKFGTFATVAERLKPETLFNRFVAYRESLGFEVFPLSGGQRPPFELLSERLHQNIFVCLMAERDLTRSGVEVKFFGELTRMPAGSAKLAIATGAPLFPAHVYYDGDDCVVEIHDALDTSSGDVGVVTQALADRFAANIAEHPQDWHMLQPQWLADLSEARRARLES
ncbi:phosphatidylinositol mannoside acyltransferase [Mycolicibacterium murale]|uniref:Phosphatidylinositol mannoside acyltransferase n=1 Tax=Mycolicibacterium murale TaxID=182220 RepID=A0A7I9WR26_9MYCO|nr:phosphatidylinositol mannoside acyltransferase [Mycolicibacterium murale]MCV7185978.1 phosphatidylinositol mannoside acyltransferase [Mycolicibacterium murale]GFG60205.1 phosphatidylinositol mannoside acyltransferase [Mycolicibacterium murale]